MKLLFLRNSFLDDADAFAKEICIEPIMHLKGNDIPVSKMSFDGTLPTNTAKLEKRGVAPAIPHWNSEILYSM